MTTENPWEERWQQGRTGWDQAKSHPALVSLIQSDRADQLGIPKRGRALVPGCGKGYDVHLFAARGLDSVGLDLASTGVKAAQEWIASQPTTPAKAEVICQDFFAYRPEHTYDLMFDYTFLCAIDPSLRPDWSAQMAHLASAGATLVTLMYPLPPADGQGPPWPLTVELYHELLDDQWDLIHCEDVPPEQMRTTGAKGGEKMGVWRKRQ
ncbi:hypothetical protein IAU60_000023 [Kwoniella sp. DSM 27419]